MRFHHVIAVVAVLLIGSGVKLFFFSVPAEASLQAVADSSINVLQMHRDHPSIKDLPLTSATMNDMSFGTADNN